MSKNDSLPEGVIDARLKFLNRGLAPSESGTPDTTKQFTSAASISEASVKAWDIHPNFQNWAKNVEDHVRAADVRGLRKSLGQYFRQLVAQATDADHKLSGNTILSDTVNFWMHKTRRLYELDTAQGYALVCDVIRNDLDETSTACDTVRFLAYDALLWMGEHKDVQAQNMDLVGYIGETLKEVMCRSSDLGDNGAFESCFDRAEELWFPLLRDYSPHRRYNEMLDLQEWAFASKNPATSLKDFALFHMSMVKTDLGGHSCLPFSDYELEHLGLKGPSLRSV